MYVDMMKSQIMGYSPTWLWDDIRSLYKSYAIWIYSVNFWRFDILTWEMWHKAS